jgi:BirA family biotin operon repressor/biotin-[acetyl-CoA-carboxylase] ligase
MTPRFYHFPTIDSTNTFAKQVLETQGRSAHGSVIIADEQTAGRGRVGRIFFSPASGLYMSLVFCPAPGEELVPSRFTVATAVAVCAATEELFGVECRIKWVNDILVKQGGAWRKVCGILAEGVAGTGIVVGIGVNIQEPTGGWAPDIAKVAGALLPSNTARGEENALSRRDRALRGKERDLSVCDRSIAALRDKLAATITERAFGYFEGGETVWAEVLQEYRRRSVFIGHTIRVYPVAGKSEGAYVAHALRINNDAALVVQTETGEERILLAGEVSTESL